MTLETERAVLLRYTRDGGSRRGSGLRVGGTLVLTAEHCTHGSGHVVVVAGKEYPAEVAWRGGRADVDIAVLNAPDLPAVKPLSWARVNTSVAARVEGCVALGFPTWNDTTSKRRAQADGYVATGEGADPHAALGAPELLTFKITTPAIRDRRVEAGELDRETTPWGGMSGAVIVSRDDQIVGVVRGHAPAAGVGSLTFTPLAAIDVLSAETAAHFWGLLGVVDQQALPVLPTPAPRVLTGPLALRDFSAVIERTRDFVGREYVFDAVDSYLAGPDLQPSGYIVITGEPGIGKTSLIAELVRTRGYVHHFNIASEDVTSAAAFLGNICAQLIIHYQLDHTALPDEATSDAGFMKQLLAQAAAKVHPATVVVLVDALDEADPPSRTNALSLPKTLPDGSFFVITTRKESAYRLLDVDRSNEIELVDDDPRNVDDVRRFVQRFISDHRVEMEKRIAGWDKDFDGFTDEIVDRGQGNFMYVRQVLNAIQKGELTAATVGGIENLPRGLNRYYEWHWQTMKSTSVDRQTWELVVRQLAVAREPISDSKLCAWTGLGKFQVRDVLREWSAFLNSMKVNGETRYRLYHRSFTDFLQALGLEPEENRACDAALAPIRLRDPSFGGSHV